MAWLNPLGNTFFGRLVRRLVVVMAALQLVTAPSVDGLRNAAVAVGLYFVVKVYHDTASLTRGARCAVKVGKALHARRAARGDVRLTAETELM